MNKNQNNKFKRRYCLIDENGVSRVIFIIKSHKGNLYFQNQEYIPGFKTKISYHTPRMPSGKSQVNFKINDIRPTDKETSLNCPINEIRGVRYLGGSGIPIKELPNLPERSGENDLLLDVRRFNKTPLSTIQWNWYLVEKNKRDLFEKDPMIISAKTSKFSEIIHVDYDERDGIDVVVLFTRIKDENPIWYQN